eukprot:jgi/Psemu1/41458/gm1.41458_g
MDATDTEDADAVIPSQETNTNRVVQNPLPTADPDATATATATNDEQQPPTIEAFPASSRNRSRNHRCRNQHAVLRNTNVWLLSGVWGSGLGAALLQAVAVRNRMVRAGHEQISAMPLGHTLLLSGLCAVGIPFWGDSDSAGAVGPNRVLVGSSVVGAIGASAQAIGTLPFAEGSSREWALLAFGAVLQSLPLAATFAARWMVAGVVEPSFVPGATALVVLGGAVGILVGPALNHQMIVMIAQDAEAEIEPEQVRDDVWRLCHAALLYGVCGVLALLVDFLPPPRGNGSNDGESENESYPDYPTDSDGDGSDSEPRSVSVPYSESGTVANGRMRVPETVIIELSLPELWKTNDLTRVLVCQVLLCNIVGLYLAGIRWSLGDLDRADDTATATARLGTAMELALFLPGLTSGHVVRCIGTWPSALLGFALVFLGGVVLFTFHGNNELVRIVMLATGMVVLGGGWNLGFVGLSVRLSLSTDPDDGAMTTTTTTPAVLRGFHDGVLLASIGVFELLADSLYEITGSDWNRFNGMLTTAAGIAMLLVITTISIGAPRNNDNDRTDETH